MPGFLKPMLAHDYAKLGPKRPLQFPVYTQPKLDGIRAIISRDGAWTRTGHKHHGVGHIRECLAPLFDEHPELVLDGELYNHGLRDNFGGLVSLVRKQSHTEDELERIRKVVQFHVYDCILPHRLFWERRAFLHELRPVAVVEWDCVQLVQTRLLSNQTWLDVDYEDLLLSGYEGQIIRDPSSLYGIGKRSWGLLKRKEFETAEFPLVRVEEGLGGWKGCGKNIVFRLKDGREVGAGVKGSMEFAKRLLAERKTYEGGEVTVRYFKPTPAGIPRFPIAIDFHPPGGRKD